MSKWFPYSFFIAFEYLSPGVRNQLCAPNFLELLQNFIYECCPHALTSACSACERFARYKERLKSLPLPVKTLPNGKPWQHLLHMFDSSSDSE